MSEPFTIWTVEYAGYEEHDVVGRFTTKDAALALLAEERVKSVKEAESMNEYFSTEGRSRRWKVEDIPDGFETQLVEYRVYEREVLIIHTPTPEPAHD